MLPSLRLVIMIMAAAPLFLAGTIYDVCTGLGVVYIILLASYTTFDALILPRRKGISVERITPERVSLGVPTVISFQVRSVGMHDDARMHVIDPEIIL